MNILRQAWERYRLLVFLVVAVSVVLVAVSPLTGCAAAARRTPSAAIDPAPPVTTTGPDIDLRAVTPVLGLVGALVLMRRRPHAIPTHS
jgi:hypothetical protein